MVFFVEPVSETLAFGQLGIFLVALVVLDLAPGPRVWSRRILPEGRADRRGRGDQADAGDLRALPARGAPAAGVLAAVVAGLVVDPGSAVVAAAGVVGVLVAAGPR